MLVKQKPWTFFEDWKELILDYLIQRMNQMTLELMRMMQLFENEVKVYVDVLIHFHRLVYVPMIQVKMQSVE